MELKVICLEALELIANVVEYIRTEASQFDSSQLEYKGKNDLVSYVDKNAEKKLVEGLKRIFPEAGFLTEEGTIKTESTEYTWIIDPVDGTTNYVYGIPLFSCTIALYHKHEGLLLGIVHEVIRDEAFYAWKGGGAYLNGKRIQVRKTEQKADALVATGFPYDNEGLVDKLIPILQNILKETRAVRRFGSAAVDLAYVACGRFDAFYEFDLNPWDAAGGAMILKEAGGKLSGFQTDDFLFKKELLGANPALHAQLLEIIKR